MKMPRYSLRTLFVLTPPIIMSAQYLLKYNRLQNANHGVTDNYIRIQLLQTMDVSC